jgi:hypothetical protein
VLDAGGITTEFAGAPAPVKADVAAFCRAPGTFAGVEASCWNMPTQGTPPAPPADWCAGSAMLTAVGRTIGQHIAVTAMALTVSRLVVGDICPPARWTLWSS